MARSLVAAKLVFNKLPALAGALAPLASQVVRKTAFDIMTGSQSAAPVDTGALKNSHYVATHDDSSYSRSVADAKAAAAGKRRKVKVLPEVQRPGELQAVVAVAVEYAAPVEYGSSRRGATPYLTPAAEAQRKPFEQAMAQVVKL